MGRVRIGVVGVKSVDHIRACRDINHIAPPNIWDRYIADVEGLSYDLAVHIPRVKTAKSTWTFAGLSVISWSCAPDSGT